jgi:hypothetical protein
MVATYAKFLGILSGLIKESDNRPDTHLIATMIVASLEGVALIQRFTPSRSPSAGSLMVRGKNACFHWQVLRAHVARQIPA